MSNDAHYLGVAELRTTLVNKTVPFHDITYDKYVAKSKPKPRTHVPQPGDMKKAIALAGKLSSPSKMPGLAWGIPASECVTGGQLRDVDGSICNKCYALKGRFVMPKVRAAYQRRLDLWKAGQESPAARDLWRWAVAIQIMKYYWLTVGSTNPMKDGRFFRIFDSGDNQSVAMINDWIIIANLVPQVLFYMPTKEQGMMRKLQGMEIPDNLVTRVSAPMINGKPPPFPHTTVTVNGTDPEGFLCLANFNKHECGKCRACWDTDIGNINYIET